MKSFWEHSNCNPFLAGWSLEASCPRVSPADFVFVLLSCLFPRPGRCSLRAPASGPRACAHHHICCRFQWIKALLKMADLCYSLLHRWAIGVSQPADPKIWIVSFVRLFSHHFKYYKTNIGDRHILEGVKISLSTGVEGLRSHLLWALDDWRLPSQRRRWVPGIEGLNVHDMEDSRVFDDFNLANL